MLDQTFDMLTIGHNYLSYIYALDLLRQGKDVALIHDHRLNYGDLYLGSIGQLEKNFLQQWGTDNKIGPFINLDNYLTKSPYTVILGQKRIRLGDESCRNYLELARKLPFCFLSGKSIKKQFSRQNYMASFDNAFDELCWGVTQQFYKAEKEQKIQLSELFEQCPEMILQIYHDFSNTINTEIDMDPADIWSMRTFLYMLRGYHQVKLSFKYTQLQLFHLLLSLLSPNYKVDTCRLMEDLHQEFIKEGGKYKVTCLDDWRFHHSRPWRVQLNSFEGILKPRKIALFAGEVSSLPLRVTPSEVVYRCLKIEWVLSKEINLTDGRIIYSSIDKIGTDQSIWEMTVVNKKLLRFNIFLLTQDGSKVSFIRDQVRKMLRSDLKNINVIEESDILQEHIEFGDEIWIEERSGNKSSIDLKKKVRSPFNLFDTSHSSSKLQDVAYYGPSKATEFGLLSSMMEIKFQAKYF